MPVTGDRVPAVFVEGRSVANLDPADPALEALLAGGEGQDDTLMNADEIDDCVDRLCSAVPQHLFVSQLGRAWSSSCSELASSPARAPRSKSTRAGHAAA
jgi:hypothetical protein